MKKIITVLTMCVVASTLSAQLSIDSETFMSGITPGNPIEKGDYVASGNTILPNQWNCSNVSGNTAGSSPVAVAEPLQYAGYYELSQPNAFRMQALESGGRATCYSLTSGKEYSTGSIYLAFMMKVESFRTAGTVGVVMFDGSHRGDFRKTCVAIRKIDDDTFSFGIGESESGIGGNTVVSGTYNIGETYLVVMKHNFNTDEFSLFVNPAISSTEPTALIMGKNNATPLGNNGLRSITVKQRSHYSAIIGGLRLGQSWEEVIVKQPQSVAWGSMVSDGTIYKSINDDPFTLPAKTDQNQPIIYTIEPATGVATIGGEDNNTFTIVASGSNEAIISAKAGATSRYEALETTIQLKLTNEIDYSWLDAPALVVEDNTVKVVGPGADKFTRITIDGVEGTYLSSIEAGREVKLEATDGTQKIRLIIDK